LMGKEFVHGLGKLKLPTTLRHDRQPEKQFRLGHRRNENPVTRNPLVPALDLKIALRSKCLRHDVGVEQVAHSKRGGSRIGSRRGISSSKPPYGSTSLWIAA